MDLIAFGIAILALTASVYSTLYAKKSFDLTREETIEKNVNIFIIENKEGIGFLPQCAALETYPLTHDFDRQIFDKYEYLTNAEKEFLFNKYNIRIPVKISKSDIRKGIDALLDDMVSKKIITTHSQIAIIREYIHHMLNSRGNISDEIRGYSPPVVEMEDESHNRIQPLNQGEGEVALQYYILQFLNGNVQESPFSKIWKRHPIENQMLMIRLAELCYYSLLCLDENSVLNPIFNDINVDHVFFEDIVLSTALCSYLVYVHKDPIPEFNLSYDLTTYAKTRDFEDSTLEQYRPI